MSLDRDLMNCRPKSGAGEEDTIEALRALPAYFNQPDR